MTNLWIVDKNRKADVVCDRCGTALYFRKVDTGMRGKRWVSFECAREGRGATNVLTRHRCKGGK